MEVEETYEMAVEPDAFKKGLFNIRMKLDGTNAVVDLLESENRPNFMRLHFVDIVAICIQEELVDLVDDLKWLRGKRPALPNCQAYPFVHVINSRWRARVPDWLRGDDPDVKHYNIISVETCIDVIGRLKQIEWVNT